MLINLFGPSYLSSLGFILKLVLTVASLPIVVLVNPDLIAEAPFSNDDSASVARSTIGQGRDFGTQAALQIPRAFQSTDIVNSVAIYEVTFITSTTGAIDKIRMDFPAGTGVGAPGIIERDSGLEVGRY